MKILPDTVVDVWKGGWNNTIARVTEAGFHSVLSAPFYLNYISHGLDWLKYYSVEPTDFECSSAFATSRSWAAWKRACGANSWMLQTSCRECGPAPVP